MNLSEHIAAAEAPADPTAPQIKGWHIVELMGRNRAAGFVQTVSFGGTTMLQIDVPSLPARQQKRTRYCYERGTQVEETIVYPPSPNYTQYVGMSAIFRITPATEQVVTAALDRERQPAPDPIDVRPVVAGALPDNISGDPHVPGIDYEDEFQGDDE